MKTKLLLNSTIGLLRAALVVLPLLGGWVVYSSLPADPLKEPSAHSEETNLQIFLRPSNGMNREALDISVELYPIDVVSAQHEYFTERRAGKRFDDFLSERMKGRRPVNMRLDDQGQTSVMITPGTWWLRARLPGEEDLEWHLRLDVAGQKQVVELTSQNIYTRTRSF